MPVGLHCYEGLGELVRQAYLGHQGLYSSPSRSLTSIALFFTARNASKVGDRHMAARLGTRLNIRVVFPADYMLPCAISYRRL